ncbi:nucleotidyltransferase [Caulobacter phage CcrBL10]|uniref:Polyribonucleotide nucleotidyltransferase n=1 Tax=Caulobacter phage CcrBL10 TaxID=2283269 RepID=A0A385E904_9CAUD|nr:nucleotidyltransferase [Caulobacter phage CcrBL10]AXQ68314.1 polyribonucleotide nucleotidyltransferase [Caulobacter phage CcrBL10]
MGNEVTTRSSGGYLTSNDDFYAMIATEANNLKGGGDGKAFMKFDGNDGSYSYGAEDEPLKTGTRMAANLRSYKRGWVIWVDGKVVYEEMVALADGPQPTKGSLPDHGPYGEEDGPVEQYTIDFRLIDEPYVEMVFQANNVSKRRALAAFLKDFGNSFRNHPGELPIIELDSNEFEGKTKGGRKVTKYAPKFKIVDWMAEKDLASLVEGSQEDYEAGKGKALEDKRGSRRGREDEDERPARRARGDEDKRTSRDEDEREERSTRRPARDEDEREERSTRRSSRDDEDDKAKDDREERPARRSRDEDEERPARRSSRDDEDERPARRSRDDDRDDRDEREERSTRRSSRDDEDEDKPRTTRGRF